MEQEKKYLLEVANLFVPFNIYMTMRSFYTLLFFKILLPSVAQTRYYKHEVSVGIGRIGVQSAWSDDYEKSVMSRFGLVVGQCTDWFVI